jgi:thiosulfate/3-mercaptopyruvate sulfurtransferase
MFRASTNAFVFVLAATAAWAAEPVTEPQKTAAPAAATASEPRHWSSLITVGELHRRLGNPQLLIVDAREPADYNAGHIPAAINLPGSRWRTPPTKIPSQEGVGQKIFCTADGQLDVDRYEKFLGAAGIKPEHEIAVYGSQAGKADGSVAATILMKLGHKSVVFVDGVGIDAWKQAGYPVSVEARTLKPSIYKAHPDTGRLWSYKDVLDHLGDKDTVFVDSRTPEEFEGKDLRGNKRGGHIPGAKLLSSEEFFAKDKTTIDYDQAKQKIESLIPDKGKKVVIYCQSGTRCTHKELLLKDLGYDNVILYDASWQEWGNLDDAPIEGEEAKASSAETSK